MRVAVVASSDVRGGAERYVYQLYEGLRDRHRVRPVLVGSLPDWPRGLGAVYASGVTPKLTLREPIPRQIARATMSVGVIVRTLAELRPDAVHLQFFKEKILLSRRLVREGLPVVWTEHGPLPPTLPDAARRLYRWQSRVATVVAVSEGTRRSLDAVGVASLVVGNPFPILPPAPTCTRGVPGHAGAVVYVGRVHPDKRIDLLLDAARLMPGRTVLIAGDGPAATALRGAAPDNVVFLGHVDDVEAVYAGAGVVVLPSGAAAREGAPLVALEARARAVPVLVADDSHAAVDAAELGCTTFAPDPDALARAIETALARGPSAVPAVVAHARSGEGWLDRHHAILVAAGACGEAPWSRGVRR